MSAVFILVTIVLVSFAIVAPWATIEAFATGRLAGWQMVLVSFVSHAYVWYALSLNSEILFCLGPAWAAYEFVALSFAPLGVMEVEDEKAAASSAANKV